MNITHHHPSVPASQERTDQLHSLSRACFIALHQATPCNRIYHVGSPVLGAR